MDDTDPNRRPFRMALLFLAGAAVFAAAYGQAPLYYSNQNQYFLHGLARAGAGELHDDWLANTRDPTPIFSGVVELTGRYLHPWAFHVYYALLMGAYAASMLGLFVYVVGAETAKRRWPLFVLLFVGLHSALIRWASYRWLGLDYPWYFQGGVAGQYILGPMFQPSTFGILLVVAVCLFLRGRPYLAVGFAALAGTVHSTYVLHAGMVTAGFLVALWTEGKVRQAVAVGALALVLILPITGYVLFAFRPTSAAQIAQAQEILVHFRLPHHCRPDLWIDPIAGLQIAWIAIGIALAGSTRLRIVLGVPYLLAILLTLLQVMTKHDTLAALFPWRISPVLVPLATAVVLARLVAVVRLEGPVVRGVTAVVVGLLAITGLALCLGRYAYFTGDEEVALMQFARENRMPGDLYFLPVRVPDLVADTRGSKSSDFQPLPDKKRDPRNVPVDLQGFRLSTGVPILVDFKSIPYLDVDLIEWRERIRLTVAVRELIKEGKVSEAVAELRRRGVTHLVQRTGPRLTAPGLDSEPVYEDASYQVYRLSPIP